MSLWKRLLICAAFLAVHYGLIFLPVSEIFIIYIILFNPRWFRNFLDYIDKPETTDVEA